MIYATLNEKGELEYSHKAPDKLDSGNTFNTEGNNVYWISDNAFDKVLKDKDWARVTVRGELTDILWPIDNSRYIEKDDAFYRDFDCVEYEYNGGKLDGESICIPDHIRSADCRNYYDSENYFMHGGDLWYNNKYTTCDSCGRLLNMDGDYIDDNGYCEDCAESCDCDGVTFAFRYSKELEPLELPYKRYFGVELETSTKRQVECNNDFMHSEEDGSISGYEHVSRKLNGGLDLANLKAFCEEALKDSLEVDRACGYHLHLDASDFVLVNFDNLLILYEALEPVFYAMLPNSRESGSYCKPLGWVANTAKNKKHMGEFEEAFYVYQLDSREGERRAESLNQLKSSKYNGDRYRGLNLQSYFYRQYTTGRGSVELRYHSGTLDPKKVINWIYIHQFLFDLAHKLNTRKIKSLVKHIKDSSHIWERLKLLKTLIRSKSMYSKDLKESLCTYIDQRVNKFCGKETVDLSNDIVPLALTGEAK